MDNKRKKIVNYFSSFSWAIFSGVLVFWYFVGRYGLSASALNSFFLSLAFVSLYVYIFFGARISDNAMDEYIAEDISAAMKQALNKISIDDSELVGDPLLFKAFRLFNTSGATKLSKKGADGVLRFTPIDLTIIHMTQNQLITYRACLDLTTGKLLNEESDEYFYKDIVSVSTKTVSESFSSETLGNIQLNSAEVFELVTSGGTSVKVLLKDPKLIKLMGGGDIPDTNSERAVQVIRKMLREKKM